MPSDFCQECQGGRYKSYKRPSAALRDRQPQEIIETHWKVTAVATAKDTAGEVTTAFMLREARICSAGACIEGHVQGPVEAQSALHHPSVEL